VRSTFLLGCQRSGTTALLDAFALSPHVRAFGEGAPEVMHEFRLRDPHLVLDALSRTLLHPVLKPICESHQVDRILAILPEAKVVWIHRDVGDVVASMLRKWPGHMLEVATKLRQRDLVWLDWRAEGLTAPQWQRLDGLLRPDLTEAEAGAIFWYLRNQWFFAHDLANHPRVLLVKYEELAREPATVLERLFAFAGLPFTPAVAANYNAESIGKGGRPPLAPAIQRACDDLADQLGACAT